VLIEHFPRVALCLIKNKTRWWLSLSRVFSFHPLSVAQSRIIRARPFLLSSLPSDQVFFIWEILHAPFPLTSAPLFPSSLCVLDDHGPLPLDVLSRLFPSNGIVKQGFRSFFLEPGSLIFPSAQFFHSVPRPKLPPFPQVPLFFTAYPFFY